MAANDESFLRQIAVTGQLMRNFADQRLKGFDLTVEQLQLLKQLTIDVGTPQNVLGEAAAKSPANITRILDRLEKKNRIVRRPNPEDRRSSLVFLTREGKRLQQQVFSLFQGLRRQLMDGVSEQNRHCAATVLTAITTNIERMSAPAEKQIDNVYPADKEHQR
jgi:DNA-binding MarR family transcriptional regulator